MEEMSGVETASENCLQLKFSTLYGLKTPTWPTRNACFPLVTAYIHANVFSHSPCFIATRCLLFLGHALHLRNACFLLVTSTPSLFPVVVLLIFSTALCICQQHLLGSLQVKVIYYIFTLSWGTPDGFRHFEKSITKKNLKAKTPVLDLNLAQRNYFGRQ